MSGNRYFHDTLAHLGADTVPRVRLNCAHFSRG